jgi:multicomponent Na+:H+ antiporter subunit F
MNGSDFLDACVAVTFGALLVAFALTVLRLLRGPTVADRVVALDMLALLGIGFIGTAAIATRQYAFLDVAIALALIGFLATVAFARYIYREALRRRDGPDRGESPR